VLLGTALTLGVIGPRERRAGATGSEHRDDARAP
jgi:hypothetical protein